MGDIYFKLFDVFVSKSDWLGIENIFQLNPDFFNERVSVKESGYDEPVVFALISMNCKSSRQKLSLFKKIIANNKNILNETCSYGFTMLMQSILQGDNWLSIFLMKNSTNLDAENKAGESAIKIAIENNYLKDFRYLIRYGATYKSNHVKSMISKSDQPSEFERIIEEEEFRKLKKELNTNIKVTKNKKGFKI